MLENPDRVLEEVHGWSEASSENPREQDANEGRGLRAASEIVTLVSASALAGGGMGMLAGVALEVINPFALGMMGVVGGSACWSFSGAWLVPGGVGRLATELPRIRIRRS